MGCFHLAMANGVLRATTRYPQKRPESIRRFQETVFPQGDKRAPVTLELGRGIIHSALEWTTAQHRRTGEPRKRSRWSSITTDWPAAMIQTGLAILTVAMWTRKSAGCCAAGLLHSRAGRSWTLRAARAGCWTWPRTVWMPARPWYASRTRSTRRNRFAAPRPRTWGDSEPSSMPF